MHILQTPAGAVGLALVLGVTLFPGFAPAAKPSAGNVVYVDNVNGDDANPGTSAEPKATIQAGEDAAEALYGNDGAVVVRGGGPAYVESVIVSSSMAFYGNKMKGKPAQQLPVVQGGFYASGIGAITVTGFDIKGGLIGTPISGSGNTSAGTGVFLENVATGTVSGNTVGSVVPTTYFSIWAEANQGSSELSISENEVIGGVGGIYLWVSGSASMNAHVAKNDVSGTQSGAGIAVGLADDAAGTFTVAENTVLYSLDGINLGTYGNSTAEFTVNKNLVSGTFMMAGMSMVAYNSSSADFSVSSNVVENGASYGMVVMAWGGVVNAFLSGNTVTFNNSDQIFGLGFATLNFISDGARSNDVRETPESIYYLYNSSTGNENGFININRELHPANETLP